MTSIRTRWGVPLNDIEQKFGKELWQYCFDMAHPDLFMRSYPEFDRHCKLVSRHICRTAARLNLPLEYNIGYEGYNDEHGITTIPHPDFWEIAAHEGCTAIIGVDAHNNQYLETPFYYDRANETLQKLGMKVTDRIPFLNEK